MVVDKKCPYCDQGFNKANVSSYWSCCSVDCEFLWLIAFGLKYGIPGSLVITRDEIKAQELEFLAFINQVSHGGR